MVSALAGVEFGERDIPLDPNTVQKAKQLKAQINELTLTLNTLEQEARDAVVRQQVEEASQLGISKLICRIRSVN